MKYIMKKNNTIFIFHDVYQHKVCKENSLPEIGLKGLEDFGITLQSY